MSVRLMLVTCLLFEWNGVAFAAQWFGICVMVKCDSHHLKLSQFYEISEAKKIFTDLDEVSDYHLSVVFLKLKVSSKIAIGKLRNRLVSECKIVLKKNSYKLTFRKLSLFNKTFVAEFYANVFQKFKDECVKRIKKVLNDIDLVYVKEIEHEYEYHPHISLAKQKELLNSTNKIDYIMQPIERWQLLIDENSELFGFISDR